MSNCRGLCKLISDFKSGNIGDPICHECKVAMKIKYVDVQVCIHKCRCCGQEVTLI